MRLRFYLAALVAFSGVFSTVRAAPFNWSGGTNNAWGTAGNWAGGVIPANDVDNTAIFFDADTTTAGRFAPDLGANRTVNQVRFLTTALTTAYTIRDTTGTFSLRVGDGGILNETTVTHTVSAAYMVMQSQIVDARNGGLNFSGTFNLFSGDASMRTYTGGTINVTGVISGSNNITVNGSSANGAGITTFSGTAANTNSGTVTVNSSELDLNKTAGVDATGTGALIIGDGVDGANSATLKLLAGSQIADTVAVTIGSDGLFNVNGQTETIGSLAGSGSTTLGAGALTAGGDNTTTTYSGVISGTGTFTKAGTGTMTLSGTNTYTGATSISAGTLALGASNVLADATAVSVTSGAVFNVAGFTDTIGSLAGAGSTTLGAGALTAGGNNTTTAYSGVMSGTGSFTKAGTGTTTFSGANTYTGATSISAGTLTLGASNVLADTTAVSVASGAVFNVAGFTDTIGSLAGAGSTTLGAGALTAGGNNTTTAYSGVISGTGTFTKAGTGTMTLSGANTYTGATSISAGTLTLGASNVLADTTAVSITSGAVFNVAGFTETIASLAGAGSTTLGAGALTAGGNNTTTAYSGVMSGTGSFTKAGTGTMTLSGTNTYTGATAINAGTLALGASNVLADATAVSVASGAVFNVAGFTDTIGSLAGAGSTTLGAGALTAGGNNTTTAYSGVMSGTGSFTKAGTGTMTLSGANTYTGATSISAGTLTLGASNVLADTTAVSITSGAVFNVAGFTETIASLAGAGSTTLGAGALTAGGNNTTTAYSGVMSGTGSFTKAGTGTMTLSGTNTYTGATAINAGTLALGASNVLADATAVSVASGAVFNVAGFTDTIGSLAGAGSTTLGAGALTAGGNNTSTAYSGVMSGTGSFTKAGTGTMTMTGANTYTGGTTISAGTLLFNTSTANVLAANSMVTVNTGGTMQISATNPLPSVGNAVDLTLNGGTMLYSGASNSGMHLRNVYFTDGGTMTSDAGVGSYLGTNVALNGNVSKTGTGTATISLEDGIGMSNNTTWSVASTGTLNVATSITDFGATKTLTKTGTGTLTLGGTTANTYSGTTTVNDGTLSLNKTAGVDATGTGTLTIGDGTGAASSAIVSLLKGQQINDSSVVEMATDGKFQLNGLAETIGSIAGTGNIALGTSGALTAGGNNGTTTYSGVIADAGSFTKAGTGTTTFDGTSANTYSGTTTVNDGTLSLNKTAGLNATGTGALVIGDGTGSAASALVTLQAGNQINDTSAVTVNADGQFNVNGQTETVGSIAGSGQVVLAAGALTAGGDNTTTDYSGVMSGTGSFTKTGSGTTTFSGASANTYTGVTTVNDGTLNLNKTAGVNAIAGALVIGDGTGSASSAKVSLQASNQIANTTDVDLKSDGVLDVGTATETIDDLGGTGTLKISSGGTLTIDKIGGAIAAGEPGATGFTGVLDVEGTLNVNGGLIKNSSSSVGTGTINVTAGNTLEFQGNTTFGGTLGLAASATLKLTDANLNLAALHVTGNSVIDFSGASTLTLGTLTIDSGAVLTINNWTKGVDALYSALWPGATYDQINNSNLAPMNQIVFTGWNASDTGWDSYNNEIYPQVPEPATYGFLLLGAGITLVASRRRRFVK